MKLTLDFETRSHVNIRVKGAHAYAKSPTTEIICVAFKVDDGETLLYFPPYFSHILGRLEYDRHIRSLLLAAMTTATRIDAHNAQFERLIWQHVMIVEDPEMPEIELERWFCTAAHAASLALPRSLGDVGVALNLPQQKSEDGTALIARLCSPHDGAFHEDRESIWKLGLYCCQDVETEHALATVLPPFPSSERAVWQLDQIINDRGVPVDLESVAKLREQVAAEEENLFAEIEIITRGEIKSARQVEKSIGWLAGQGLVLPDLTKTTVADALKKGAPTPEAKRFLEIRQSLAKASVAKLAAFEAGSEADGRARGLFLYHGASTGRWAGRKVQPQNFVRDSYKTVLEVEMAVEGAAEGCPIMNASKSLRGMICAKDGKKLLAVDFSSIEARVLAWGAGEHHVLKAFRDNLDLYKVAAQAIYGVPYELVTADQRQIGKVSELALGYQGWAGAFITMGEGYGVKLVDEGRRAQLTEQWKANEQVVHPLDVDRADFLHKFFHTPEAYIAACEEARAVEIVKPWRAARPATRAFWYGLEDAAKKAVTEPGAVYSFGPVKFKVQDKFLFMRLPSGRNLAYYEPMLEEKTDRYKRTKMVVTFMADDVKYGWQRWSTYGGKLTENWVQAVSRDLLVHTMQCAEALDFDTVMHVHDELVCEMPDDSRLQMLEQIARQLPVWAAGLPMGAAGWAAKRYKKG